MPLLIGGNFNGTTLNNGACIEHDIVYPAVPRERALSMPLIFDFEWNVALDLPMQLLIGGKYNRNTLNNGAGIENAIIPGRA